MWVVAGLDGLDSSQAMIIGKEHYGKGALIHKWTEAAQALRYRERDHWRRRRSSVQVGRYLGRRKECPSDEPQVTSRGPTKNRDGNASSAEGT